LIYLALALLVVFLALLGAWQRRIDRARDARTRADIRDAASRGAHRPLAQHPQIDVAACIGCGSCIRACPEDGVLGLVDGVAHVIAAAKCIGHARCADVCPVGAITVGLGDVSGRNDLPRLTDDLETTVPGIFVAGELGGLALIRNAVGQGARAMEAIAERVRGEGRNGVADVLVVGAGPSGLAASLKAIELGLRYVTIDRDDLGGTVRKYPRRKLVMTQPVALPLHGPMKRTEYRKEELIELWSSLIRRHGVDIRSGVTLLGATPVDGGFEARTSAGPVRARTILLALGRRGTPRRLGVPGEECEKVLYQLVDAATYRDLDLLVVGGGDSAIEAATALAEQPGNRVTLSYRKDAFFRVKARNAERIERYAAEGRVDVVFSSAVESIGDDHVVLQAPGGTRRIDNAYTFVFAGGEPPYPLLRALGVGFHGEAA